MPMTPKHPDFTRRFTATTAIVVALVTAGCQTAPPPATIPPRNPAPTRSVGQKPPAPVSCTATPTAKADGAADFETIDGDELDLMAYGAAADALTGSGTVDITTEESGRPEFHTVEVGELDHALRTATEPILSVEASGSVAATGATTSASGPGDPRHAEQWSDSVTPFSPAWSCGRGSGVDIAVLDTGVDGSHPDLAGRTSTGGTSLNGAATVTAGGGNTDPHGHGTHVAGIAAATADNGVGIAGVAPLATIIPVRVLNSWGSGWSSDVAAGITWAVDAGAEVINLSLGSTQQSQAMTNAVTYARAKGVIVVAAAGNGGPQGPKNYPAADNRTLAVASIGTSRAISGFSTHGGYVDIAAPGSSILSSIPGGGYGHKSGTSMATPFVSGVVALLVGLDGSLTPDAVATRLMSTADDAGTAGTDPAFGAGIVNPVRAMSG